MTTTRRSRTAIAAALLAAALSAPVAAHAEEWVSAGGGPVPAADAAAAALAPVAGSSGGDPAGFHSVEASRVLAARRALQAGDLGSEQEEVLLAVVAPGPSRAETGGSDAVEGTRAAAPGLTAQSAADETDSATLDEAEWLAKFRAVDRRILAEYEGAAHPEDPSCGAGG